MSTTPANASDFRAPRAQKLPPHRDPAVLSVLLWWLGDTLPGPKAPRWQGETVAGFQPQRSSASWKDCDGGCGGKGRNRWGKCPKCEGAGGWYTDPMDSKHRPLVTEEAVRPRSDVRRTVRLSSMMDEDAAELALPVPLAMLAVALVELRGVSVPMRAMVQRVYLIRLDRLEGLRECDRVVHDAALCSLSNLLPGEFRAPRWVRVKAAERLEKAAA